MAGDPWEHRSSRMLCQTCMYFVPKVSTKTVSVVSPESVHREEITTPSPVGRCRRHAPTMNGYPVVFPNDWCGDHKLDETKVDG